MSRKLCWGQFNPNKLPCRECDQAHACMRAKAGEQPGRTVTPGLRAEPHQKRLYGRKVAPWNPWQK
jgi:hypothetical protein